MGGRMYHACWEEVAGFDVVEGDVARDLAYGVSWDVMLVRLFMSLFFMLTHPTVKTVLI